MKLNDAPVAGAGSFKVQSKFAKFLLVIACGEAGNAMNASAALAAIAATTVELERVNSNGTFSPGKPLPLSNYLEIGSVLSRGPVTVETAGDVTTITGDIIFGFDGDLEPKPGETYTLKISGLPAYCKADVYLIATRKPATIGFTYDKAKADAGIASLVELTKAHLLAIPKTDFVKIELESDGQDRLELLAAELKSQLVDLNAQAFNINGAVTPVGLDLYTFPVPSANRGYVTANTDKTLIVVKAQTV